MKKMLYALFKTKPVKTAINFLCWTKNVLNRRIICQIPEFGELAIRKNTSDESAFWQVFVDKEYDIPLNIQPKLIIDGGANIGCATLWFRKRYPEAEIIAVEPEESNFKMLELNTESLPNVKLINAGIWNKEGVLKAENSGLGKWGFQTKEGQDEDKDALKAVTIDGILADSGFEEIDILKLDIEGSEKEVFGSGYENWLGKTKVIIIELHERMREGAEKSFYAAIERYGFKKSRSGENIVLERLEKN